MRLRAAVPARAKPRTEGRSSRRSITGDPDLLLDLGQLLDDGLLLLDPLVLLRHDPGALHPDADTLLETAVLAMLPRVLGDRAVLALRAVVGRARVDAPPEEGPAAVTGDGAVMDMVVGHVPAHLARDFSDELGPLPLGLGLGRAAGQGQLSQLAPGTTRQVRRPGPELPVGQHPAAGVAVARHAGELEHSSESENRNKPNIKQ